MSEEELDPLAPALAGLFAEERGRAGAPAASKARVRARLEASIVGAGDGGGDGGTDSAPGAPGAPGGGPVLAPHGVQALPLLGALLAGVVLGGAAVWTAMPPRVVYVDRPVAAAAASPGPAPADAASVATLAIPPAVSSEPPAVVPEASGAGTSESRDGALAAERAILDTARTALGRGDGAHALEAAGRHARAFPRGQMTEEREAIAVQALVKLGRKDEAAARGERFRKRYPNSVLGPVIDAALDANR